MLFQRRRAGVQVLARKRGRKQFYNIGPWLQSLSLVDGDGMLTQLVSVMPM
jgi:hypothetical protein